VSSDDITLLGDAEPSQSALSRAVDAAGDVVFLTDCEGVITQVNARFTELYGHRAEDVVGKVTPRILKSGRHPADFYARSWAALLAGETFHAQLFNRTLGGRLLHMESTVTPFRDGRGQIAGFVAIQREVGERKQARLLQTVALGVAQAENLDAALAFALRQVCETHGWAVGEAWVPDATGAFLESHPAWFGVAPELAEFHRSSRGHRFGPGAGLVGRAWESGRPEWCADLGVQSTFERAEAAARAALNSGASVPVLARGEVVLVLAFFLFERGSEDAHLLETIAAVAAQIGTLFERHWALAALRESEARFRSLFENSMDGIFLTQPDGTILAANPAACRLLGRSEAEIRRVGRRGVVDEDDARFAAVLERRSTAGAVRGELSMIRGDGTRLEVDLSSSVYDTPSGKFASTVIRDLTDRRRLEAQLVTSERMASMGMLAAGVAHELNNPLAAVITNLELAIQDVGALAESASPPPDLLDELSDAHAAAQQLRAVVRDLRVFSRADEQRVGPIDIHRAIESAARMASNEIRHRARLEKAYAAVPPVAADEPRLAQVFLNLLVNAAQAIPEGHAETNVIRISTRVDGADTVVVEIADSGTGMSPEVQARIFEPFFTSKPSGLGTGLGLAICQRIVTAAGGRVGVESEAGRGSTFSVFLPTAKGSTPASAGAAAAPAAARRARVLVIDDDVTVGRAVARVLGRDHDVVTTTLAREALDRLTAGERFDVILCDVMMPMMTGIEFHRELERLVPGGGERVIFLTGGAFTPSARTFLDHSANPTIDKPFELDALRALVAARVA
jgi:PAS domain S-box-containing protein